MKLEPAGTLAVLLRYVEPHLRGDAPVFGSREWADLPPGHPAKLRATVRAAVCWWNRVYPPLPFIDVEADAAEELLVAANELRTAVDWHARAGGDYSDDGGLFVMPYPPRAAS